MMIKPRATINIPRKFLEAKEYVVAFSTDISPMTKDLIEVKTVG